MKIGKAIREVRKKRGISQNDLALRIGKTQTSMSLIESDIHRPHPKTLAKICYELAISEPLLHVLAMEERDVIKSRRKIYRKEFPTVKRIIGKITNIYYE